MKKFIIFISLFASLNLYADELHNYDQIKNSAITGKNIHIVIDFSKCLPHKTDQNISIGVFTPNALQVLNHSIATSLTHFTLNNPGFPNKPVYEFVTYSINDDNNVNLTYQVLDATNYLVLTDKISFNCKLDESVKIYD